MNANFKENKKSLEFAERSDLNLDQSKRRIRLNYKGTAEREMTMKKNRAMTLNFACLSMGASPVALKCTTTAS